MQGDKDWIFSKICARSDTSTAARLTCVSGRRLMGASCRRERYCAQTGQRSWATLFVICSRLEPLTPMV